MTTTPPLSPAKVSCDYCGEPAPLVDSSLVYDGRSYGPVYVCFHCEAWVGVHKGTENPLGRLANAELRRWKIRAHDAFDRLWLGKIRRDGCSKSKARKAGYRWLADQLGIPYAECHIGMMDVDRCRAVVEACSNVGK